MQPLSRLNPEEDVARTAAGWVERLTADRPGPEDVAALRAWVAADPAHRRAYEQARAIWTDLPETNLCHRRPVLRLIAGSVVAACLALALFVTLGMHDQMTRTGEVRRFVLPDGSTAWLDSDSAIDFSFDAGRRILRLARGRVAVAVARDGRHPFQVVAGDAVITDVGTVFSVDRGRGLDVAVSHGIVDVARAGRTTRLRAGAAGSFGKGGIVLRPTRARDFAWRDGRIQLDRVRLDDALTELDRYYDGRILLLDPALASRRVSGTLFTDRVEEGVETVARSENLRITRLPWVLLVQGGD